MCRSPPNSSTDLASLDNVDQMSPQAELLVAIEIGGRRERALLVGIPDYADQAVDVVRITSGEVPRGMQVLTDQGNEANAVISLAEGDDITVRGPDGHHEPPARHGGRQELHPQRGHARRCGRLLHQPGRDRAGQRPDGVHEPELHPEGHRIRTRWTRPWRSSATTWWPTRRSWRSTTWPTCARRGSGRVGRSSRRS